MSNEYEVKYFLDNRNTNRPNTFQKSNIEDPEVYFKQLIQGLIKNQTPHKINWFVDLRTENERQRIQFINGVERAPFKENITKNSKMKPILRNNDYGGLKISWHEECNINTLDITDRNVKIVRIGVRISFKLAENKTLDITLIKNSSLNNLKEDRKLFIYAFEDYLTGAPFHLADWIECEIEFLNLPSIQNAESIGYKILLDHIDHTYNMIMGDIAYLIGNSNYLKFREFWNFKQWSFSKLLSKAKEISRKEWKSDYVLTDMSIRLKIRGERHIIYIDDRSLDIISINNTTFKIVGKVEFEIKGPWIFDCELLSEKYYILHPLVWDGEELWKLDDNLRLQHLKDNWESSPDFIQNNMLLCPIMNIDDPFSVKKQITKFQNKHKKINQDGLLPSDLTKNYWDQRVIKWKDSKESTFDFLITQCPKDLMGKKPYVSENKENTLYVLWCYININDFTRLRKKYLPGQDSIFDKFTGGNRKLFPTIFDPINTFAYLYESDNNNLEGEIGEFLRVKNSWKLCHIRNDKKSIMKGGSDMGNYYNVALDIYSKLSDPFTLDDLTNCDKIIEKIDDKTLAYNHVIDKLNIEEYKYITLFDTPYLLNLNNKSFISGSHILVVHSKDHKINLEQINLINKEYKTFICNLESYKIDMPPIFIGGGDLTICMNNIDNISKLPSWCKTVQLMIKHGGKFIYISKNLDVEKLTNEFIKINIKFIESIEFETNNKNWYYHIYEREFNAEILMTGSIISRENNHLKSIYSLVPNKTIDSDIKFARQKTKDCIPVPKSNIDLSSLNCNVNMGLLLCEIEFISQYHKDVQLYYYGHCKWKKIIKKLFPTITWITEPNKDNVEIMITHDSDYKNNLELIKEFAPKSVLMKIDIANMYGKIVNIMQGKMIFVPYLNPYDNVIMIQYTKPNFDYIWNIRTTEFEKEMNYFHQKIRTTCYSYKKPITENYKFDCCYDCKSMVNILTKYIRSEFNEDKLTYENVIKIIL